MVGSPTVTTCTVLSLDVREVQPPVGTDGNGVGNAVSGTVANCIGVSGDGADYVVGAGSRSL